MYAVAANGVCGRHPILGRSRTRRPPSREDRAVRVRRWFLALAAAVITLPALVAVAVPAQADMYRYWSFWQSNGSEWVFVQTAPTEVVPANGEVNGWRFGVGGTDGDTTRPPRSTASYSEICGTDPAPEGQKKVAEIIDTGTPEDAPEGSTPPEPVAVCATVPNEANAVQTLQAVADVRLDQGLLCGIFGYPASGCGDVVAGMTTLPSDSPTEFALPNEVTATASAQESGGLPTTLLAVTGIAVVLGVIAVLVARSRQAKNANRG